MLFLLQHMKPCLSSVVIENTRGLESLSLIETLSLIQCRINICYIHGNSEQHSPKRFRIKLFSLKRVTIDLGDIKANFSFSKISQSRCFLCYCPQYSLSFSSLHSRLLLGNVEAQLIHCHLSFLIHPISPQFQIPPNGGEQIPREEHFTQNQGCQVRENLIIEHFLNFKFQSSNKMGDQVGK